MNTFLKIFVATAFAASAMTTYAQSTVGELLDGGAKKMTKEEATAYLAGFKLVGPTRSGEVLMNLDLKADGSFSGNVVQPVRAISSGTSGKWVVDGAGKTCAEGRLFAWNMNFKECFFAYQLGDVVYRTLSDSDDRYTTVRKALEQVKTN